MDKASAENPANYVVNPGNIVATNASLDVSGTVVTLTTGTPLPQNVTNTLTITGVKDYAGNPVAPGTTISFKLQAISYEANILFDQPVAYYRFEDAVGSPIAHNSGSTGGDGGYYTNDTTAADFAPAAAATFQPLAKNLAAAADASSHPKVIGMQVGAVSFVDEGTEKVLDILQERGAINTLFLTTFTYGRGLAGRQIPGHPFPDHGSSESDEKTFHGGNYATPHPEFYGKTVLKQTRAPEHGELDIVASVLPAARKRGMKLFCSIEDVFRNDVPAVQEVSEIDLQGRKGGGLCLYNPNVRAFWTGLATDLCKSYDIDGILFFNERNGPLLNALGASHAQSIASSRVTCFCAYHQAAAKAAGINFERAKEGYQKLDQFIQSALANQRPGDGYFVEWWRLLVEYPEIIAWDRLFDAAKHQVLAKVNAAAKDVSKELQVGFHIEHVNSFNPISRATRSYKDLATNADFLKVVVYNNCGGERYANFTRNIGSTVFRDVPPDELL